METFMHSFIISSHLKFSSDLFIEIQCLLSPTQTVLASWYLPFFILHGADNMNHHAVIYFENLGLENDMQGLIALL